jgi:hypothetical protein
MALSLVQNSGLGGFGSAQQDAGPGYALTPALEQAMMTVQP